MNMASNKLSNHIVSFYLPLLLFLVIFSSLIFMNVVIRDVEEFFKYYELLLIVNIFSITLLLILIASNLFKLHNQVKKRIVGSKLNWRIIRVVSAIIIIPSLLFYIFSLDAINRNIDNLQTLEIEKTIQNTIDLSNESIEVALLAYKRRTEIIADDITIAQFLGEDPNQLLAKLRNRADAYELSLFTDGGVAIATNSVDGVRIFPTYPDEFDRTSVKLREIEDLGSYIEVVVKVKKSGKYLKDNVLLALYPISKRIITLKKNIDNVHSLYKQQDFIKGPLKRNFMINMSIVLFFSLFMTLWLTFRTTEKLLVKPLNNLSRATKEITAGNYRVKITGQHEDDFADLINLFNNMTTQIELSRNEAEKSHKEVIAQKLYLETILKYSYGVITLDKDKKVQLINNVCEDIFKEDLQAAIGMYFLDVLKKYSFLKPILDLLNNNIDKGNWRQEVEVEIKNKKRIVDFQVVRLLTNNDLGTVIVLNDVTDLNKAQRQAAWGEVARRLAHEIKNPLTPIRLSAERLRHKYLKESKNEKLDVLDKTTNTIIQQVSTLEKMVSAFSDYAKSPKLDRKPYNLNGLIANTLELYKNKNIIFNKDNKLPKLLLDKDRIQRLLINLIKNAIEATNDIKNYKIELLTEYKKNQVIFSITDNGKGFNKLIKDNLFEPYVTTKIKGTGLGMAIVYKIIEEHQASINVENIKPQGAKITITFDI